MRECTVAAFVGMRTRQAIAAILLLLLLLVLYGLLLYGLDTDGDTTLHVFCARLSLLVLAAAVQPDCCCGHSFIHSHCPSVLIGLQERDGDEVLLAGQRSKSPSRDVTD